MKITIGTTNTEKVSAKRRKQNIENFLRYWTTSDSKLWGNNGYGRENALKRLTMRQILVLMKFYIDHQSASNSMQYFARRFRAAVEQMDETDIEEVDRLMSIQEVQET